MKKIISVFLIIVLIQSMIVSTFAATAGELQNQIDEAEKGKANAESEAKEVKNQKQKVVQQIQDLEYTIAQYEKEISDLNSKISKLKKNIDKKTKEINKLKEEYEEKEELLKERLVAMYEIGQTTYLDVLLSSSSLTDLVSNYYMVSQLAEADNKVLDSIESSRQAVEKAKKELETQKKELDTAKKDVVSKNNQLLNKKEERQQKLNNLSAEEKELQSEIKKYEQAMDKLQTKLEELSASSGGSYSGGSMKWPLPGYTYISSGFGYRDAIYVNGVYISGGRLHAGIDIPAAYGTSALAAASGTVRYVGWDPYGYGNYVVLDHGGGILTLYGHGSSVPVSTGQKVSRGQTVLKVGSTGASTGNHLHFEVIVNGTEVNPLNGYVSP